MFQLQRVSRSSLLEGWTPGLLLGVLFYVSAVLVLYFAGARLDRSLAPCFLLQVFGFECPLCGGTTASLRLLGGSPLEALSINPLVTLAMASGFVWIVLWTLFGLRVRFVGGDRVFVLVLIALLMINWLYVIIAH